jgi:hypothetical protein
MLLKDLLDYPPSRLPRLMNLVQGLLAISDPINDVAVVLLNAHTGTYVPGFDS